MGCWALEFYCALSRGQHRNFHCVKKSPDLPYIRNARGQRFESFKQTKRCKSTADVGSTLTHGTYALEGEGRPNDANKLGVVIIVMLWVEDNKDARSDGNVVV